MSPIDVFRLERHCDITELSSLPIFSSQRKRNAAPATRVLDNGMEYNI